MPRELLTHQHCPIWRNLLTNTLHLLTNWLHLLTNWLHLLTNWLHFLTNSLNFLTNSLHFPTNSLHFLTNSLHFLTNWLHFLTNSLHFLTNWLHFLTNSLHFLTNSLNFLTNSVKSLNAMDFYRSIISVIIMRITHEGMLISDKWYEENYLQFVSNNVAIINVRIDNFFLTLIYDVLAIDHLNAYFSKSLFYKRASHVIWSY